MTSQGDTTHGPDDEKILKYAVELFRQLGIAKPEPDSVVWEDDTVPDLVVVRMARSRCLGA